ncbi:hypothetical protein P692DRAFT_201806123 [Suillus brevipes Sb2]|nr:hypothetical protein P692DRAFT_201806123 [Suillus brevipes Sb2]
MAGGKCDGVIWPGTRWHKDDKAAAGCISLGGQPPEFEPDPNMIDMLVRVLIAHHGILHYHGQTRELATFQWPTTKYGLKYTLQNLRPIERHTPFATHVACALQGADMSSRRYFSEIEVCIRQCIILGEMMISHHICFNMIDIGCLLSLQNPLGGCMLLSVVLADGLFSGLRERR